MDERQQQELYERLQDDPKMKRIFDEMLDKAAKARFIAETVYPSDALTEEDEKREYLPRYPDLLEEFSQVVPYDFYFRTIKRFGKIFNITDRCYPPCLSYHFPSIPTDAVLHECVKNCATRFLIAEEIVLNSMVKHASAPMREKTPDDDIVYHKE
jgi:hypothetical protein